MNTIKHRNDSYVNKLPVRQGSTRPLSTPSRQVPRLSLLLSPASTTHSPADEFAFTDVPPPIIKPALPYRLSNPRSVWANSPAVPQELDDFLSEAPSPANTSQCSDLKNADATPKSSTTSQVSAAPSPVETSTADCFKSSTSAGVALGKKNPSPITPRFGVALSKKNMPPIAPRTGKKNTPPITPRDIFATPRPHDDASKKSAANTTQTPEPSAAEYDFMDSGGHGGGDYDYYADSSSVLQKQQPVRHVALTGRTRLSPSGAPEQQHAGKRLRLPVPRPTSAATVRTSEEASSSTGMTGAFGRPLWEHPGALSTPDLEAALRVRWPGRDATLAAFVRTFCAPNVAYPPPGVVSGRSGLGRSAFVLDALRTSGALHAVVECATIENTRKFMGAALTAAAQASLQWVVSGLCDLLQHRVQQRASLAAGAGAQAGSSSVSYAEGVALLMRALMAPGRQSAGGQATAIALCTWGNTCGTVRAALQAAFQSPAGGGADVCPSDSSAGVKRLRDRFGVVTSAQIKVILGPRRIVSAHGFFQYLGRIASLGPDDLLHMVALAEGVTPSPAVYHTTFPLLLVLRNADRILNMNPRLVTHLTCPSQVPRSCLAPVFLLPTHAEFRHALAANGRVCATMHIEFRPPTTASVMRSLVAEGRPARADPAMWGKVVQHVKLAVGALTGYDSLEMSYAAAKLYGIYAAPTLLAVGSVNKADDNQLRRIAEPAFAAARSGVLEHVLGTSLAAIQTSSERGVEVELPYYPKLLLISAFCASHNPATTDKRYFSRQGSGRSKGRAHVSQQRGGGAVAPGAVPVPHAFKLERWMAIFQALLAGNDYRISNNASKHPAKVSSHGLQEQMLHLETLRLVQRMSSVDELDVVRFRCMANVRSVAAVAAKLDIDLGKYLHSPQ